MVFSVLIEKIYTTAISFHIELFIHSCPLIELYQRLSNCEARLWREGAVGTLGGGVRVVCMRNIGRNMDAGQNTYFGRHFAWLKCFTHQLVPILAPNYKQHIFRCFLCPHTPTTNKNEVTLLSQLIFFSYYYADERNYCTLGFIFIYRANIPYLFPFLHRERHKAEILRVDNNKRFIQV
jgi:hypothetical protein